LAAESSASTLVSGSTDPFSSEILSEIAIKQWLNHGTEFAIPLRNLSQVLHQQHSDRWFVDYLSFDRPPSATTSLVQAVDANHDGQLDKAFEDATRSIEVLSQHPNDPVALRARFERVYSLRRESKGAECARDSDALSQDASRLGYTWLATQSLLEESSCQAMIGAFDSAWHTASRARAAAEHAHYASLRLRAVSLEAALDNNEGRIERAWDVTVHGLSTFFANPFPDERGFQFYSELEFAAEQAGEWELASHLQKEAIAFIHPLGRYDFEATAHFHLAAVEEALGDAQPARQEIEQAKKTLSMLPASQSRQFLEAESRIALGLLEAKFGSPHSASIQLSGLEQTVEKAQNFTVRLSYEKSEAELQRRLGNEQQEIVYLKRCIEIGEEGYRSLTSAADRWDWERTTGSAYRRLIEIDLSRAHDPLQNLAEWETYRASAIGKVRNLPLEKRILHAKAAILTRIKQLGPSSAIVYARFPKFTAAWLLNRGGVQEFRLPGGNEVDHLVKDFYSLCSDPTSSEQKVKSTGLRLYKTLLGPIEEQGALQATVHIEADGSLATIPWLALTSEDGTYLAARLSIVNTPLAMHVDEPIDANGHHVTLIAYPGAVSFGRTLFQPLKDAAAETSELAARTKEAIFLRGSDVTALNLAADLPRASMFHFAGHAVTRDSGGELLVHGPQGGELFSARTISRLNLTNLRLAVLAACDTGTTWDAAKNPNGLVGAFLIAGTHRVVASLWPVDSSSTSRLMSRFYLNLERGNEHTPDDAWLHAIEPELARHPYYWAGFQVFGQ